MLILVAIIGFLATASAKDITVGDGGELIYNQNITASPSVWVRKQNVTIDAPEEITRIVVIDNREDKNGEAAIVEGGVGHNNVTIELKSPAVFRGFYFEIQVYAKPVKGVQIPVDNDQKFKMLGQDTKVNDNQTPKDNVDVNVKGIVSPGPITSSTPLPYTQRNIPAQHPVEVGNGGNQQQHTEGENSKDFKTTENTYVHPLPVEMDKVDAQVHNSQTQEPELNNVQENFDKLLKEVRA